MGLPIFIVSAARRLAHIREEAERGKERPAPRRPRRPKKTQPRR